MDFVGVEHMPRMDVEGRPTVCHILLVQVVGDAAEQTLLHTDGDLL